MKAGSRLACAEVNSTLMGRSFFFFNLYLGPTRCITSLGLVQEVDFAMQLTRVHYA